MSTRQDVIPRLLFIASGSLALQGICFKPPGESTVEAFTLEHILHNHLSVKTLIFLSYLFSVILYLIVR